MCSNILPNRSWGAKALYLVYENNSLQDYTRLGMELLNNLDLSNIDLDYLEKVLSENTIDEKVSSFFKSFSGDLFKYCRADSQLFVFLRSLKGTESVKTSDVRYISDYLERYKCYQKEPPITDTRNPLDIVCYSTPGPIDVEYADLY